ncbi:hypothetical protein DRQ53_11335 [bacterium]|nr:MAG: hypothetical protein DRQ32_05595 [bacterium]RKZ14522.1 MAG: hypothetical protein DRQ53_11335 [bacterium]
MSTTRQRILDTAEVCFAKNGFDGCSLREITSLADMNLGAVNYHFGSKGELFTEVLRRRIEPMNRRRLELLDLAIARHEPESAPLEEILYAFVRPAIEAFDTPARGTLLGLLRGVHEGSFDPELFNEFFAHVLQRFSILRDASGGLSELEYLGRIRFVVGGMIHLLADRMWRGSSLDTDTVTQLVVAWAAGTFRAPILLVENETPGGQQ